jgi:hypothetical protein
MTVFAITGKVASVETVGDCSSTNGAKTYLRDFRGATKSFSYKGKNFLVVNSTGGQFSQFKEKASLLYIFNFEEESSEIKLFNNKN